MRVLSHVWLFGTPWTVSLLCPWNFPGKNTGVGCHFLFQGIFLTQASKTGLLSLLQWQEDSWHCFTWEVYPYYPKLKLVAQTVKNLPAIRETWVRSLGQEDPLEHGTVTHSSFLAWRIPWTEELGRLQSMGLQRVRHDWVTFTNVLVKSKYCI